MLYKDLLKNAVTTNSIYCVVYPNISYRPVARTCLM